MDIQLDNDRAFDGFEETVKWRQDQAPHLEGSFPATVINGESQSESAGPTRGGFAADPWTVIANSIPSICCGMKAMDTIELKSGTILTVQQITRSEIGWIIRCTANARAPK